MAPTITIFLCQSFLSCSRSMLFHLSLCFSIRLVQCICVLLWLLDDYWYYALMTLGILIVLEVQLVERRLSDLGELRSMRMRPRQMRVLRNTQWIPVSSDDLVPGDVVALARQQGFPGSGQDLNRVPCDMLLIQGEVVVNEAMLTGESVPQLRSAAISEASSLDVKGAHRQHVLSAGTSIVMHRPGSGSLAAPSGAAIAVVLRTGFDTTQGKLVRTILFSVDRVTVSSKDAFHFLGILLFCAVLSAAYVLREGLSDPERSRFKLFLACSHIITNVVPPEFPITLSLAVTLSLVQLLSNHVYCTEPFRVPFAGQVDCCCFDKTGTLTAEQLEVGAVYGLPDHAPSESGIGAAGLPQSLPFHTMAVMAGCTSNTVVDGELVGDPLDKAAMQSVLWSMIVPDMVSSSDGREKLQILQRFPFQSELARMAVVAKHVGPGEDWRPGVPTSAGASATSYVILAKGSPEALRPLLASVPSDYDETVDMLGRRGMRVICLAWRPGEKRSYTRDEAEKSLNFAGFLVLKSRIKAHTVSALRALRVAKQKVVMITGDHPLTAAQVALDTGLATMPPLLLGRTGQGGLQWRSVHGNEVVPFDSFDLLPLAQRHTLVVAGSELAVLPPEVMALVSRAVQVFARTSPQQKESIVYAMNDQGMITMMVGDGTNDVGALKRAHVGVSLLNSPAPSRQARLPSRDDLAMPTVQLGDASIASPFTHKGESVKVVLTIMRCGRATLSTVIMMYKIMALNSLASAFAMSVLSLDGVKLGDGQTAMESVFISTFFFLVSRSQPAPKLVEARPTKSIFEWHVLLSLLLQAALHFVVLITGWSLAKSHRPTDYKPDKDGDFEPNWVNTTVFLITAGMHLSSFLANYQGAPFLVPITKNRAFMVGLGIFSSVMFFSAAEVMPDLTHSFLSLSLAPNDEARNQLVALLVLDVAGATAIGAGVHALQLAVQGGSTK
mmetsp:Transcript_25186/g.64426  ORF Transcript_25186/g.64426 Transcript_25186/m.64426 type:complete len:951 (-) Transcript_25186:75-2927(-)